MSGETPISEPTDSGFVLSDNQADAVGKIIDWFRNRTKDQQICRLFGFAGTGKTTILKYVLADLNATLMPRISRKKKDLDFYEGRLERESDAKNPAVMAGCFTGKASLVMTRKGTPASTIHSMCYIPQEPTKEAIEEARKALASLRETGPAEGMSELMWRALIRDRELQLKNMHRPTFILNADSPVRDCDLIVLDEVSMVGPEMAADLMSFGKPILVLGDPGQLPPIKGEGAFTQAEPDVMLTEIHRQAEDSAIIRLATMAREGKFIPFGRHSDEVWKLARNQVPIEALLKADQVMVGMNATRMMLNNQMKAIAGYPDAIPTGDEGQKLICLKNQHDIGLVNGMFLTLANIGKPQEHTFRADIATEDGAEISDQFIYNGHFLDHVEFDKERAQRDYFEKRGKVECTWGWAITVHKSQGSAWQNIVLYDDGFGRGEDRKRWLYTGITRGEKGLLILG